MEDERRGTPVYKIAAFVGAGLIVASAVGLVVVYGPALRHETPTDRLAAALAQHFPGSEPTLTPGATGALKIALKVSFDPTVDAEQAHGVFTRVGDVVRAQPPEGIKEVEVELQGVSLEGGSTAASRTFEVSGTQPTPEGRP